MLPFFSKCMGSEPCAKTTHNNNSRFKDKSAVQYYFGGSGGGSGGGGECNRTNAVLWCSCSALLLMICFALVLVIGPAAILPRLDQINSQTGHIIGLLERDAPPLSEAAVCKTFVLVLAQAHSGAQQLQRFLSLLEDGGNNTGVCSYHASHPAMVGPVLARTNREGMEESYAWRARMKRAGLDRALEHAAERGCHTVFEVSPHTLESWYDVGIDYLSERCETLHVLVLRRYTIHVVQSLLEENFGANREFWYRAATHRTAIVPAPPRDDHDHDHDDVFWYMLDSEARLQRATERAIAADARVVEVRFEQLMRHSGITRLCNTLGIGDVLLARQHASSGYSSAAAAAVAQWRLPNNGGAGMPGNGANADAPLIAEMNAFLDRYRISGISIPELPAMALPATLV